MVQPPCCSIKSRNYFELSKYFHLLFTSILQESLCALLILLGHAVLQNQQIT